MSLPDLEWAASAALGGFIATVYGFDVLFVVVGIFDLSWRRNVVDD
jgi:hypothetical protein